MNHESPCAPRWIPPLIAIALVCGIGSTLLHAQSSTSEPWSALTYPGVGSALPAGPGSLPPGTIQGPAFHAGGEPLGICYDPSGATFAVPTVYVADLYTGTTYLYDATDLSLLGTVPSPAGASVTSGVTTDGTTLYWAADETLYTSNMDGTGLTVVGSIALPLGGTVGDITLDDLGRIWAIDVVNDVVSAHDATSGAAIGLSFGQPAAPGAYGNGIAFRGDCGHFELLHGTTSAGQVTDVSTVSSDGVVLGTIGIAGLGPFVNGLEVAIPSPGAGVPSIFFVDNASGALFEVAAADPCPAVPADCHALASTGDTYAFEGFPSSTVTATPGTAINDTSVANSTINVVGLSQPVRSVSCAVSIDHTWIGDLDATLRNVASGVVVQLHDSAGLASDDLVATFDDGGRAYGPPFAAGHVMQPSGGDLSDPGPGTMADFVGGSASGLWRLRVTDNFPGENGTLDAWSLTVTTALAIPDGDVAGTTIAVDLASLDAVGDLDVALGLDHPAPNELTIELISPLGTVITLETAGAPTALLGNARFDDSPGGFNDGFGTATPSGPGSLADIDGEPVAGTWMLRVIDDVPGNVGVIRRAELLLCAAPCDAPFGLVCSSDCAADSVALGWTNGTTYDAVEVRRDGALIATLAGTATSHVDTAPGAGVHNYQVSGVCTSGAGTTGCEVLHAPYAGERHVVVQLESPFGAIDSAGELAASLAATGDSVVLTDRLSFDCFDALPLDGVVWVCLGTFPDSVALSDADGDVLTALAADDIPIFLEGADVWGFDPATSFADYDGVENTTAEDGDDSFIAMTGATHAGLALAGQSVAYEQDQTGTSDYTDRLLPTGTTGGVSLDLPGVGAGSIWSDTTQGYVTGVFYDPAAGARVIAQSWEFGGYGGDRDALALAYRNALAATITDPLIVRGNVNTNAGVDVADAVFLLNYLFIPGSDVPPCFDAADANDDAAVEISDAVFILNYLFIPGSDLPPAPFPECGFDSTPDALDCLEYFGC